MSEGFIGYGSKLYRKNGDGSYTKIAEVRSITLPSPERGEEEFTHLESPDRIQEFKPTLIDPGELGFNVNLLPTDPTHDADTGLIALRDSGEIVGWKVEMANAEGSGCTFDGWIKTCEVDEITAEGKIAASVGVRVTTKLTWF